MLHLQRRPHLKPGFLLYNHRNSQTPDVWTRARTSLPSAVVRKLPSRCTSSDVATFPVSSVRTIPSVRMSHTLHPAEN